MVKNQENKGRYSPNEHNQITNEALLKIYQFFASILRSILVKKRVMRVIAF